MYFSDWIKNHYPKAEDAKVVCKWFGGYVNEGDRAFREFYAFLLRGRELELLELAHELEQEEKDRLKNPNNPGR